MAILRFLRRIWQALVRVARAVGRGLQFVGEVVIHYARRIAKIFGSDSAKKRGRAVKSRSASLISVGLVLLLLGAIGFSVYQVARHMTVGLGTLRTQEIEDESYVRLELFVFRDEALLTCEGSEVCRYTVRDGEKLGVGRLFGSAYAVGNAAPDGLTAEALQARLNSYSERIALLESMSGLGTPADARAEAEAVDRDYMSLLEAVSRGDLAAVDELSGEMLAGIGRYDILTGNTGAAGNANTLRAEQDALLSGLIPVAELTAETGGYFYYGADGYESVFPYASAMTMTPAEFVAMMATPSGGVPAGTVGKMVYDPTWYAAAYVPLSDPAVELFQQGVHFGTTYDMVCGETTFPMKIERFVPDEGGVLLVFSTREMPAGIGAARTLRVETVARSVSGYRIPGDALVTLRSEKTGKEVDGVYILSGGVVEFRKVRIRVHRDGYIIVDTYEDVKAMLEASPEAGEDDGWEYLKLNDNIITSGNGLYEGRVIH